MRNMKNLKIETYKFYLKDYQDFYNKIDEHDKLLGIKASELLVSYQDCVRQGCDVKDFDPSFVIDNRNKIISYSLDYFHKDELTKFEMIQEFMKQDYEDFKIMFLFQDYRDLYRKVNTNFKFVDDLSLYLTSICTLDQDLYFKMQDSLDKFREMQNKIMYDYKDMFVKFVDQEFIIQVLEGFNKFRENARIFDKYWEISILRELSVDKFYKIANIF